MKIKTELYGFFYKQRGKWSKHPYMGQLLSREDILWDSELGDDSATFKDHLKNHEKMFRRNVKKKVKAMIQVFE